MHGVSSQASHLSTCLHTHEKPLACAAFSFVLHDPSPDAYLLSQPDAL